MVALNYNEQLEGGLHDLAQLADLAHSWKLQLAEPYVSGTGFCLPQLPGKGKLLRLSDLYNFTDLNFNLMGSIGSSQTPIVPMVTIRGDVRDIRELYVVILKLVFHTLPRACNGSVGDVTTTKHVALLCSHIHCPSKTHLTSICLNTKLRNNFRALPDTNSDLQLVLRRASQTDSRVVVLIPNWNGIRPNRDKFFYWDPDFRLHQYQHHHAIWHSPGVQSAARDFVRLLHLAPPTLGIHIRLERLLKKKPFNRTAVESCLARLESLIKNLKKSGLIESSVLFRDYGRFGSKTCGKYCHQMAREMRVDQRLESLGVRVQEFKVQAMEPRQEHAFNANVEQEVLMRTDFLATLGFGSFQRGVVDRWRRYRELDKLTEDRVFLICNNPNLP